MSITHRLCSAQDGRHKESRTFLLFSSFCSLSQLQVNIMMDANLVLQIEASKDSKELLGLGFRV